MHRVDRKLAKLVGVMSQLLRLLHPLIRLSLDPRLQPLLVRLEIESGQPVELVANLYPADINLIPLEIAPLKPILFVPFRSHLLLELPYPFRAELFVAGIV